MDVQRHAWSERFGAVLQLLDPVLGPKQMLERLWSEVSAWGCIVGVTFHAKPGHLVPPGSFMVGTSIADIEDAMAAAAPATAPIVGAPVPLMARQVRDGNVSVATVLVAHDGDEDAAAFLVDAIARWCMDRLRVQLEVSELAEENVLLRGSLAPQVREHEIRTVSGVMHALIKSAVRAAASTATVLIQGETGTGKELLARLVHTHSQRSNQPMVSVNVAALTPTLLESELFGHAKGAFTGADQVRKGLFEVADGGTLFLDEVGEMGPEVQVRLLRVLQERCITRVGDHKPIPVEVRIIAATHRDLAKEVETGRFREDLFYRLNVVNLQVPPLRRRTEDIPILVAHFLEKYNRQNFKHVEEVPRDVLEMLCAYPWPGNIRELENCVQKAVVLSSGRTFPAELVPVPIRSYAANHPVPASFQPPSSQQEPDPEAALREALARWAEHAGGDLVQVVETVERMVLTWALNRENGVKLRAARMLGINRVTLDRKLAAFGLEVHRGAGVVGEKRAG
ncbi:MAG: sigma-54-dependent Fis family transcriptional regulator [Planctomycetes bacterium]|nr:sigma-54-dependent Fis family transcriptional regulator [Planctomycetota bacterium]